MDQKDAWVIGTAIVGTDVDPAESQQIRQRFEKECKSRAWLKASSTDE